MHNVIVTNDGLTFSFALSLLSSNNIIMFLHHGSNIYSAQQSQFSKWPKPMSDAIFRLVITLIFARLCRILFTCQQEGTAHTFPQQQHKAFRRHFQISLKKNVCNNSKAANAFQSL